MPEETVAPKARGWPKGKPRGVRAPLQEPIREQIREGAVTAIGRDGEVLSRKRTSLSDDFHVPPEIIPSGWAYQWNLLEVYGQPQVSTRIRMQEGGWRPVPCGRHPGRYMPNGTSPESPIIRDGLILEERPIELEREAQAEERAKASNLMQTSQEQLGLSMPSGFDRENRTLKRMERAGTSRTIAPAGDISRPRLEIDPTG